MITPCPEISVVIPVYNSTDSVVELVERLKSVLGGVCSGFEVILVDDGSGNPMTWKTIEGLAGRYEFVKGIQLMRNFGKAGAVLCGLADARGEYVILMDDDLQNKPEDIPRLFEMKEHDVVIGCYRDKKHGLVARLGSRFKGFFDRIILGKPRHILNSPFKLIKYAVAKSMLQIRTPYPMLAAMLFYVTSDVVNVDVEHEVRKYGKSTYTLVKRFKQFLRLLINNSSLLLQFVAGTGFSMAMLSAVYAVYLLFRKLYFGVSVSGWTSIMTFMAISTGLILFSIGVVGEYLIRIINGIELRPPYIVRRDTEAAEGCSPDR